MDMETELGETWGRVGHIVTPDTLVYTFAHSRSRGIVRTNHRDNRKNAVPSAATPPASARGVAAIDTKRPPLTKQNHPRAITILQSPNGLNIDKEGRRFLVLQATITQPSDE